ncbi:MAG TPA: Flp pilus assembly protein CpaB [Caulobacterales bacterium]|nr:Flp pilus assembly protein CpaB [Caulobacterales bacterium]
MSARQLIVLGVAFLAAIAALFLIKGMGARPSPHQAEAAAIAGEQVLVALHDIPQGAALTSADFGPRLFPQASVNSQFVSATQQADLVGAVTRRPFIQGEPIVRGSVVQANTRGFMAAQLEPGYRAIAVKIESKTAAGDFIQPNDHVDVIMTARDTSHNDGDAREQVRSEVILQDVRVLAIGEKVQTQTTGEAPEQAEGDTAVLELTADDARILAQADEMGDITLALRGVESEPPGLRPPSAARGIPEVSENSGGGVRIHAFGVVSNGGGS